MLGISYKRPKFILILYWLLCMCARSCDVTPSFLSIVIGPSVKCACSSSYERRTLGWRLSCAGCSYSRGGEKTCLWAANSNTRFWHLHTLYFLFPLHLRLISYVRLHMCVCVCVCVGEREGRKSCLPFLWRGKCIRQSGGKTKERIPVLRHLPKELLKSSPRICLYAFCKCSLLK